MHKILFKEDLLSIEQTYFNKFVLFLKVHGNLRLNNCPYNDGPSREKNVSFYFISFFLNGFNLLKYICHASICCFE